MSDCSILQDYITNFKNTQGYYPGYQECFNFLQGSGMNEMQVSNCMQQYLSNPQMNGNLYNSQGQQMRAMPRIQPKNSSVRYNNGDISMGVL